LTTDELEVFARAFDEMRWCLKRIEELPSKIKNI